MRAKMMTVLNKIIMKHAIEMILMSKLNNLKPNKLNLVQALVIIVEKNNVQNHTHNTHRFCSLTKDISHRHFCFQLYHWLADD